MIGVIADPAEHGVVREFFELFKTPWEFYRRDRQYDVVLCAGDAPFDSAAKLVLFYAGKNTQFDREQRIPTGRQRKQAFLLTRQVRRIPIYGEVIAFQEKANALLTDEESGECAAYLDESDGRMLARIGYDLFSEVRSLLMEGQPAANAAMPALESHIAFLRDLITGCGIPLAEIPPVPDRHRFIACLTHDVDHPSIRRHKWDHTMFGFLYRAVLGSVRKLMRGEISLGDLLANWTAALKLPFMHLGLAKDIWGEFGDRYLEVEKGVRSTFFVIPFANQPGGTSHGPAPAIRGAGYGAQDIADALHKLTAAGDEVGLHGIDAWRDSSKGHQELEEIRRITGSSEIGARMHWLYYGQQSPEALEAAGAAYDSTIGYNDAVGYRAGTTQVYKPLGATRLLELPLHVMDTALFYPNHLGLSGQKAKTLVGPLLDNSEEFGGVLTINWHDRSLVPERLWGGFYADLIRDLQSRGAWFATAGQATSWFRKRRSAKFEMDSTQPGGVRATVSVDRGENLPALRLRIHAARKPGAANSQSSAGYADVPVDENVENKVSQDEIEPAASGLS